VPGGEVGTNLQDIFDDVALIAITGHNVNACGSFNFQYKSHLSKVHFWSIIYKIQPHNSEGLRFVCPTFEFSNIDFEDAKRS